MTNVLGRDSNLKSPLFPHQELFNFCIPMCGKKICDERAEYCTSVVLPIGDHSHLNEFRLSSVRITEKAILYSLIGRSI